MGTYNYTREIFEGLTGNDAIYNGCAYDINNPMHIDLEGAPIFLFTDILNSTLQIDPLSLTVSCNDNQCSIIINNRELDDQEKETLDQVVQDHKNYRSAS
jgi:hypothetical protein